MNRGILLAEKLVPMGAYRFLSHTP